MYIAQKKRKENIIEYILYMWSIEDLARANNLDIKKIEQTIVSKYQLADPVQHQEMVDWWDNICEMMRKEKKEHEGHLQILTLLANDIYNYHLYLLTQQSEIPYQNAFKTAWPDLNLLMTKIPGGENMQHVLLGLNAIYNYYLLKLQQKTVLADTTNAVLRISHFLAILSQKYLQAEKDLEDKK